MDKAQKASELIQSRGFGNLATNSIRHPGTPFVSLVEYALNIKNEPVFLLSGLAVHSKNLLADPKASLIIYAASVEQDPMNSARVTLMGEVHKTSASEAYLDRHPHARQWAGFGDFSFYAMTVTDTYFVGGFGQMGWI